MNTPRNAVAVARTDATAFLERYEKLLTVQTDPIGLPLPLDRCQLIPAADLPALGECIAAGLRPASGRQVAEAIAMIAGAWPYAHQKSDATAMDIHARMLTEDLAQFPADILVDAIRQLRRTLKFAPAIAEIYESAMERLVKRKGQLAVIEAHRREHARRAAVERAAAVAEAERRDDLARRLGSLVERHGAGMERWTPDDLEAAGQAAFLGGMGALGAWLDGIDGGAAWVVQAMPILVTAGRLWPAFQAGKITSEQVIRKLEASVPHGGEAHVRVPHGGDSQGSPWPHLAAMIAAIRGEVPADAE